MSELPKIEELRIGRAALLQVKMTTSDHGEALLCTSLISRIDADIRERENSARSTND